MKIKPFVRSFGLILLADGARAVVSPGQHARRLQVGSALIDDILDYVAENRPLARKLGFGEMAIGLFLTLG